MIKEDCGIFGLYNAGKLSAAKKSNKSRSTRTLEKEMKGKIVLETGEIFAGEFVCNADKKEDGYMGMYHFR